MGTTRNILYGFALFAGGCSCETYDYAHPERANHRGCYTLSPAREPEATHDSLVAPNTLSSISSLSSSMHKRVATLQDVNP